MQRRGQRKSRDLDGFILLDKAVGYSSNQALQQVRQLFHASKAGHCGSLDPLASGLLPICLGEATKFSSYLLDADKTYLATCRLGQTTTTGDAEGDVIEERPVSVNRDQISAVFESFIGEFAQVPPMYSALKHEGKRLYQLAREGRQIARKPRQVKIRTLILKSLGGNRLEFEVTCSKGTYIRTLAEDMGAALGCGAYLSALRRQGVDQFTLQDAVTIEQLQQLAVAGLNRIDRLLQPVSQALNRYPELELDLTTSLEICQGKRVRTVSGGATGLHRLRSWEGRFLGLGEVFSDGELVAKRLMNTAR